jgi:hypothetical protein
MGPIKILITAFKRHQSLNQAYERAADKTSDPLPTTLTAWEEEIRES